MQTPFTHGSLFSGIGGFDLAAEWMGWENRFHCEWNPFGQKVLKHYWPRAESFSDITKTDFTKYAKLISVLTGGFPCQPYSAAGKRLGKEDERHLWPHMLRAIREIQPRWVVGENVLGLVDWNGGMVFDEVLLALETAFQESETYLSLQREGYEVFPYVLPASGVGAPHQRYRIWFVAYADGAGLQAERPELQTTGIEQYGELGGAIAYPFGQGLQGGAVAGEPGEEGTQSAYQQPSRFFRTEWKDFPTVAPLLSRNDGVSAGLDTAAISFGKWRTESVKAAGNAIVPQVALQIFRAIAAYESLHSPTR
jgi:DNA (cytosine-5)-methyltransferase 1